MRAQGKEPKVTQRLAAARGLSGEEYGRIKEILGRLPVYTELEVAAALWSEHCSYKSSKVHLQGLPVEGDDVLQGPGENAGVVDIGNGWVAVFKMESRDPSLFDDPYQGSAAAVGGVLRDVFAMGARPIAMLDSLRFGSLDAPRTRQLVDSVVRGVGDYANCAGVPTVGGETGFNPGYGDKVLVNAFALGLARRNHIARSGASQTGSRLLYGGRRTDCDRRLAVAKGTSAKSGGEETDPFAEKILLEACLAAIRTGAVVAVHDLGAAGLAGAAFEMASRGGCGVRLELDRVPLAAKGLAPYEILLSESQERMLLAVERGRQREVVKLFERWGVELAAIGEVRAEEVASAVFAGKEVLRLPVPQLIEDAPMYRRPVEVPKKLAARQAPPEVPEPGDPGAALERLLATPELGCKSWIWRQFDHTVRTNTVVGPGGDAAVLLLKGTPSGLAMTSDVNPAYCGLDPASGGEQAVAEAVRNLACVGAEPVGLSDSLSFGKPEDPEVAWQFRECVRGMTAACKALGVPVVSGDVSFYGAAGTGAAIPPTPTIAMVGLIPDLTALPAAHFTTVGDRVLLLGRDRGEFGGSAYLRLLYAIEQGRPPAVDLGAEERLADLLRFLAFDGLLRTAHDLAEGGLAVALAEACIGGRLGVDLSVDGDPLRLFSETQARAILAVAPADAERVLAEAEEFGVPAVDVGSVGGKRLKVRCDGAVLDAEVETLYRAWSTALPKALAR